MRTTMVHVTSGSLSSRGGPSYDAAIAAAEEAAQEICWASSVQRDISAADPSGSPAVPCGLDSRDVDALLADLEAGLCFVTEEEGVSGGAQIADSNSVQTCSMQLTALIDEAGALPGQQDQQANSSPQLSTAAMQLLQREQAGVASAAVMPARLLQRLATHVKHDSVGSMGRLTGSGDTVFAAARSGVDPSDAPAISLNTAAEEAGAIAQSLLQQAHGAMQREAGARQAAVMAAQLAVSVAQAEARELEAQGHFVEAAAAVLDADR